MRDGARTAATLTALVVLLLGAVMWGWSQVTAPLPKAPETKICTDTAVREGEKIYPDQVVVNVLNAGRREGLAGRTQQLFSDQEFVAGERDNTPDDMDVDVKSAQVWAADKSDPAVRLVKSRLPKGTPVVDLDSGFELGITVVVGDEFETLRPGKESVTVKQDTTLCIPPATANR
ncbi:LytR C-terminal domain-containing protein [Nocardioides sp.]|uniref:LytR C-terminal domain-containing protein n=1 Tax=Nocardioides sp. TaxID=35761 RepID=UPI003564FF2A